MGTVPPESITLPVWSIDQQPAYYLLLTFGGSDVTVGSEVRFSFKIHQIGYWYATEFTIMCILCVLPVLQRLLTFLLMQYSGHTHQFY